MGKETEALFIDLSFTGTRFPADNDRLATVLKEKGFDHLSSHGIQMRVLLLKAVDARVLALDNVADILILDLIGVQFGDHKVGIDCDEGIFHISVYFPVEKPHGQVLQYFWLIYYIIVHQISP